eukprot:NODE_746_length_1668_cov_84.004543_g736_i0.p1 GENE.NODE_746_length_1668_cov_84.004543_g736_i0~~NODE_746_length_1668_cov_84.004543_g736_i0.p1  ORF type:complete len:541 (+),score=162.02 NODE_746_length_1668_cov_84.004543_g736_i0:81-1625(+)
MGEGEYTKDYGEAIEYDPSWSGVAVDRRPRDCVFGVLFILVMGAMVGIGIYALANGHPCLLDEADQLNSEYNWVNDAFSAIKNNKYVILGMSLACIVAAMLWVQLLRMFAEALIYITLAVGIIAIAVMGVVIISIANGSIYLQIAGGIVIGIAVILAVIVFFLRKRIHFTALMIREACTGLNHNLMLFTFMTPVTLVIFIGVAAFWIVSTVYLFAIPKDDDSTPSSSDALAAVPVPSAEAALECLKDTGSAAYNVNRTVQGLILVMIFAGFWFVRFVSATIHVVFSGALAQWYFSRGGVSMTGNPTLNAIKHALIYSFGSVAFGSLILAVVDFINYIIQKARDKTTNACIRCCLCCVQCLCMCIRSVLEYLNRYAYIYIAMYGTSFVESAKSVFKLMGRSGLERVLADMITNWVLFLGNLFITGLLTTIAALIVKSRASDNVLNGWPVVLVAIMCAVLFHYVAVAVRIGADTVFVCYCEDMERNAQSRNYYVQPDLHDAIQERSGKLLASKSPA